MSDTTNTQPTLLDLHGLTGDLGSDVATTIAAWEQRDGIPNHSIPLGVTGPNTGLRVNFDTQAHGGSGPHGMQTGSVGSGKTYLQHSMVGSLALNNSPEHLQVVTADFKGGSFARPLEGLPHLRRNFDNVLDSGYDFAEWIDEELRRREEVLAQAHVEDHDAYLRRVQRSLLSEQLAPLPRLVVFIDEIRALFLHESNKGGVVQLALEKVASVGRSLGVYLHVSSQTLDTEVLGTIRDNLSYGITTWVDKEQSRYTLGGSEVGAELAPVREAAFDSAGDTTYTFAPAVHDVPVDNGSDETVLEYIGRVVALAAGRGTPPDPSVETFEF